MSKLLHVLDASREPRVPQSEATPPPTIVSSVLTTPSKRICTSRMVHVPDTPGTAASRLRTGRILHWTTYTRHRRKDIIFMKKTWEHVSLYWQQHKYLLLSELLYVLDANSERHASQSEATPPPITVSGVLITRPWPIRPNGRPNRPLGQVSVYYC